MDCLIQVSWKQSGFLMNRQDLEKERKESITFQVGKQYEQKIVEMRFFFFCVYRTRALASRSGRKGGHFGRKGKQPTACLIVISLIIVSLFLYFSCLFIIP